MTVRGVFAQANVGHQHEIASVQLPQGAMDDTVVVPCPGPFLVLLLRDAEEDHALDTEPLQFVGRGAEGLDRVARQARKLGIRQRLGPDEEGHDEVVEVEPRLAREPAQPGRSPQPPQPRHRKRAHGYSVTLGLSGSEPQTVLRGQGQPPGLGSGWSLWL